MDNLTSYLEACIQRGASNWQSLTDEEKLAAGQLAMQEDDGLRVDVMSNDMELLGHITWGNLYEAERGMRQVRDAVMYGTRGVIDEEMERLTTADEGDDLEGEWELNRALDYRDRLAAHQ